jgi:L-ascorbate metabolism protein UlaG (beta-lactamase superfamily)
MVLLAQCASSPPPDFSETEWFEKTQSPDVSLLYASNVDENGLYFNPWMQREPRAARGWRSGRDDERYKNIPEERFRNVPNDYSYLADNTFDSITFAGHASMIVKMNGQTIFTDPFFSNAAVIVQKKVKIKFDYTKAPQNPVVLISHNHYDHLDKSTMKKLIKKDPVIIVPMGLKRLIEGWGAKIVHELNWWESVTVDGIEYTLVPAQHWSRRLWQEGGSVLWGGYIIQGSKTVYFSGDTGYFIGFKEFGSRWNIDYAIMGTGAYEPRWFMHYAHMNVQEFIMAAKDIKARFAIPMHFGVIQLGNDPVLYPLVEFENEINANPALAESVLPLRVGEFVRLQ